MPRPELVRERILPNRPEELIYKCTTTAHSAEFSFVGQLREYVHVGTDAILRNQQHYKRTASRLTDIAQGYDVPDERFYINQLMHGLHGPITGTAEAFYTDKIGPLTPEIMHHLENAYAAPGVLKQKYGTLTHFIEVIKKERPKKPTGPVVLFDYASDSMGNKSYQALSGKLLDEDTRVVWTVGLNYIHQSLAIGRSYLTGVMTQEEAIRFITEYEQRDLDQRLIDFTTQISRLTHGAIVIDPPTSQRLLI